MWPDLGVIVIAKEAKHNHGRTHFGIGSSLNHFPPRQQPKNDQKLCANPT